MELKSRIADDMKSAMRDKDAPRLETIRMLRAAIQRREVDERITLNDTDVLAVVQKMIKQGRDSISQFESGDRVDLADKERFSIGILESYLPEPLDDAEVDTLIDNAIAATGASEIRDMGKVMAQLKTEIDGRADMGAVSARVRSRLSA
ncbi:MAG: aspartyl-tRNA amidotransferase subunit B [marine bacterium B5-7]|nr:MAG: aspartyl-tRNA amidotransferase subunit B [marine bacterium B5-7]